MLKNASQAKACATVHRFSLGVVLHPSLVEIMAAVGGYADLGASRT